MGGIRIISVSFLFVFLVQILSGCATVSDIGDLNRNRLIFLDLGMERSAVLDMMARGCKTAYASKFPSFFTEMRENRNRAFFLFRKSFATIDNPYKTDCFECVGKKYLVDYYWCGNSFGSGDINEEGLVPICFEYRGGKYFLIGWGRGFLESLDCGQRDNI